MGNRLFIQQLHYTRDIIIFMLRRQQVPVKNTEIVSDFGTRYYFPGARRATRFEWEQLYQVSDQLNGQLTLKMVPNFAIWRLRKFFGFYPLIYLATAATCLLIVSTYGIDNGTISLVRLPPFFEVLLVLAWTCALGGLGVSAFFGTSLLTQLAASRSQSTAVAPSGQISGTDNRNLRELTDNNYLRTRVMVGILFSFVLGLPFGYLSLMTACQALVERVEWDSHLIDAVTHIMAPFILGFSTTVVLAVLERIVEGVRTILGVQQRPGTPG